MRRFLMLALVLPVLADDDIHLERDDLHLRALRTQILGMSDIEPVFDRRTSTCFAWLPTRLDTGEHIWLRWYTADQEQFVPATGWGEPWRTVARRAT